MGSMFKLFDAAMSEGFRFESSGEDLVEKFQYLSASTTELQVYCIFLNLSRKSVCPAKLAQFGNDVSLIFKFFFSLKAAYIKFITFCDTPHFNMAIPGGSYMMAAGFFN